MLYEMVSGRISTFALCCIPPLRTGGGGGSSTYSTHCVYNGAGYQLVQLIVCTMEQGIKLAISVEPNNLECLYWS